MVAISRLRGCVTHFSLTSEGADYGNIGLPEDGIEKLRGGRHVLENIYNLNVLKGNLVI